MIPDLVVRVVRVGPVVVPLPRYQTSGAAGLDLCAALERPIKIKSLERALVPTGIAIAIPHGFDGQVRPRSGLASKLGITVLNAPGTIDADYRGEVKVLLVNLSSRTVTVSPLDRVAQLVLAPVGKAELRLVDELDPTERGAGGYGSTGLRERRGDRRLR